jgi:hypothetical protein
LLGNIESDEIPAQVKRPVKRNREIYEKKENKTTKSFEGKKYFLNHIELRGVI